MWRMKSTSQDTGWRAARLARGRRRGRRVGWADDDERLAGPDEVQLAACGFLDGTRVAVEPDALLLQVHVFQSDLRHVGLECLFFAAGRERRQIAGLPDERVASKSRFLLLQRLGHDDQHALTQHTLLRFSRSGRVDSDGVILIWT